MFIVQINILNPGYSATFLPIQINIKERTQFFVSIDIIPDIIPEYDANPQYPTWEII